MPSMPSTPSTGKYSGNNVSVTPVSNSDSSPVELAKTFSGKVGGSISIGRSNSGSSCVGAGGSKSGNTSSYNSRIAFTSMLGVSSDVDTLSFSLIASRVLAASAIIGAFSTIVSPKFIMTSVLLRIFSACCTNSEGSAEAIGEK